METIMRPTAPSPTVPQPSATPFTATWQNGFEVGGHVQRKLRLTLANLTTPQPA